VIVTNRRSPMAAGAYWTTILGGALVVAFGGLVVTYGWNQRTVSLQRLAFARSVATELVTNLEILEDKTFQPDRADDVHQIVLFPLYRSRFLGHARGISP
jgi:hypothetical protein